MKTSEIKRKLKRKYRAMLRWRFHRNNIKRLRNDQFSIISSNCVGGVIYHELGKEFLSPTINLWFTPDEFFRFAENLDYYLSVELNEDMQTDYQYPVGKLDDIHIYFMHYESFQEAKYKWNERVKRINCNSLYIMMVEWPNFGKEQYERFENLPYSNKVLFTAEPHREYPSTYCIPNAKDANGGLKDILKYKSYFTGKRYIDDFDYVSFLNKQ